MKNTYEIRFRQLIVQQKREVETLKTAIEITEKRCLLVKRIFSRQSVQLSVHFIAILAESKA
jgi:hypothetical protein